MLIERNSVVIDFIEDILDVITEEEAKLPDNDHYGSKKLLEKYDYWKKTQHLKKMEKERRECNRLFSRA